MAEKYKWDFTPPSQWSRGALTQEAALGLLDMIKPEDQRAQMTARMEVAMRRVVPLVKDEAAASNVNDNDDDNMIEEITETEQPTAAAAATTTRTTTTDDKTIDLTLDEPPTRPARVPSSHLDQYFETHIEEEEEKKHKQEQRQ
eukprot:jgi/Psemu1/25127/gm1.25127_g